MKRLLLTFLVLLTSISISATEISWNAKTWDYGQIKRSYASIPKADSDEPIIEQVKKAYNHSPYLRGYDEISFRLLLCDTVNKHKYYLFFIDGVDDLDAVYVVNDQEELIDNFLLSYWSMYEEKGPRFPKVESVADCD